ncbi:40S ribosomal protein S5-1 [Hordeum vulgare]|nr:40S ribosomal protein S5-1 [Hordeum vulgare]
MKHPQSIKMSEGMLHIRDVEGPKKTGSMETRLEAMEQQVFKCQGMVERGLNANHMMITEFTSNHKMDAIDIGKHLSRLYDRVDQLQGQIYDLQNQKSTMTKDATLERTVRVCVEIAHADTTTASTTAVSALGNAVAVKGALLTVADLARGDAIAPAKLAPLVTAVEPVDLINLASSFEYSF